LLESYPEMDALFVANDQMALGVLHGACRQGLRVPQDLALLGFDGMRESAYYCYPLTTEYQDLHQLGCTAVRTLVHAIEASRRGEALVVPVTISLRPELIIRASAAGSER
jgi:DNA-binding LacI/PurR family transcriptional regulator